MTVLTRSILQHVLNVQCNTGATNSRRFTMTMTILILLCQTLSTESYAWYMWCFSS